MEVLILRAKESNEINNKELKENIANVAIGLLEEGSDYNELAYTKVEFGYLFDIDDHGIEALLKVITLSCQHICYTLRSIPIQLGLGS